MNFCEVASGRPGKKFVMCSRPGAFPVMIAARDAEQIGDAQYAVVNRIPSLAR